MTTLKTKQEILDQIALILGHSGWTVSSGSTEPRIALEEIAESIGIPLTAHESKRSIARTIVESWGMSWYPSYESTGETITRLGLSAVLDAVILATGQTHSSTKGGPDTTEQFEGESRAIQMNMSYRFQDHKYSDPDLEFVDGSRNWFYVTDARKDGLKDLRFQAGIWNPKIVKVKHESRPDRTPLLVCTTVPDRAGSYETPWHDKIDKDEGRVLYFGDNKDPQCVDPSFVRGNRIMIHNQTLQHSLLREDRELASPVLLVEAHGSSGSDYRFRMPIGLGVIWRSDQIIQQGSIEGITFPNFRFEIILLDLKEDNDLIEMKWIHSRRMADCSSSTANQYAPTAWKIFLEEGIQCLPRVQLRNL